MLVSFAGYSADGPGGGASSGQGGSYGGVGTGVTDVSMLYGSIETPDHYGSQGFGATSTSNRGGGYIKVVATESVQIGNQTILTSNNYKLFSHETIITTSLQFTTVIIPRRRNS